MKITLYYEDKSHPTILEVSDEECTVMVETDYQQRLETAEDKTVVKRRTVQEIMDAEVNKPTFNNNHAETRRHASLDALVALEECEKLTADGEDIFHEEYADLYHAMEELQPQQRELVRKIFWEGMKQREIASTEGIEEAAVSRRMARIYARLKKILEK